MAIIGGGAAPTHQAGAFKTAHKRLAVLAGHLPTAQTQHLGSSATMSMNMMEIDHALKQLRLSGVRATLETRLIESQVSNLPFLETFSAILQDELDRRQSRLLERRFQLSGLDERASLAEFDWNYNPRSQNASALNCIR
jgi:hypothetical protein